jgi:tetratricopeptide (TPR) repeat protein
MDDLLRQGIAAAKAGQREHARDLLMRVVEQDEENGLAWLWLSGVVDSLDDREVCLENVLSIDPDNTLARNGLELLYRQLMREGTAAAKAGQRERARELLTRVVEYDEKNVPAWLWLSDVVDGLDERQVCLENVLSLDPYNDAAHKGLALIERQKEEQQPPPASVTESPVMTRAQTPATPAAAILRDDFASRRPPEPEPEPPPLPQDEFGDEYLCPYCATLTEPQDRKCQACGGNLWIKFRQQEKRSTLLWTLISFQFFNTFQLALFPVLILAYALVKAVMASLGDVDVSNPLALINVYLELPTALSPEVGSAALATVPRFVFFLSFLPCLFAGVVLVGLFLRWKPVYYLLLADAGFGVIIAFTAMILTRNIAYGVIGLVIRGNLYNQRKMWAMAAIHLRQAAGLLPNDPDCHLALTVAYLRLNQYEQAVQALDRVKSIIPGDPKVEKLKVLLDELHPSDMSESTDSKRSMDNVHPSV